MNIKYKTNLNIKFIKKINAYIIIDKNNNIFWQLTFNKKNNNNKISKNLNNYIYFIFILSKFGIMPNNKINEF